MAEKFIIMQEWERDGYILYDNKPFYGYLNRRATKSGIDAAEWRP